MILDFDDACWTHENDNWKRSLVLLLTAIVSAEQHSVLATTAMLTWCDQHLALFTDYFRTRLAGAQPRANALEVRISPVGKSVVTGSPPWALNADAARIVAERPLRLVLENDSSDLLFVKSTVSSFSDWHDKRWIEPVMGGGGAMTAKIDLAAADALERWRTFFMFDSDRLHPDEFVSAWSPPGGDSCQGHTFEVACASMPARRWHRLNRRSIENYLPSAVLQPLHPALTSSLLGAAVGRMAHYYDMKRGTKGDQFTRDGSQNLARWARSKGFWSALPQADVRALEQGYGRKVSEQFCNIPPNHAWSSDVIAEMTTLADALQDAM